MSKDLDSLGVRPLTRINRGGVPYQRLPAVEQQIKETLGLEPRELLQRAKIEDANAPEYLQAETLAYYIREYRRSGNRERCDALTEVLLGRMLHLLRKWVWKVQWEEQEDLKSELVHALLAGLLNVKDGNDEYAEVRFWDYADKKLGRAFYDFVKELNEIGKWDSPAWASGQEAKGDQVDDQGTYVKEVGQKDIREELPEFGAMVWDALSQLEQHERLAFVMHYYAGWKIESTEMSVPTISGYFDKTPRTIRNWMTSAERKLAKWREETQ